MEVGSDDLFGVWNLVPSMFSRIGPALTKVVDSAHQPIIAAFDSEKLPERTGLG